VLVVVVEVVLGVLADVELFDLVPAPEQAPTTRTAATAPMMIVFFFMVLPFLYMVHEPRAHTPLL
jgi:hypothetical protein